MAYFESGVASYIHGVGKVENFFPVGKSGRPYICCEYCDMFLRSSQVCPLTHEPILAPSKFVGDMCPLMPMDGDQFTKIEATLCEIAEENAKCPPMEHNE